MGTRRYTLSDFQKSLQGIRKLGGVIKVIKQIPGMRRFIDTNVGDLEKDARHIDGIINAMTPWEREHPDSIEPSRTQRIARGSGATSKEIISLLRQFDAMRRLNERMGR